MNQVVTIAPVKKSVTVGASQEVAFETFTAHIGRWWPKDHGIGKAKLKDVRIEPRTGGRAYEIDEDGAEVKWGTVVLWEPHERLIFTWQITSAWQPAPHDERAVNSEIEVRFVAQGPATTRVELEHRNFERMGGEPGAAMRNAVDSGWPALLGLFAQALGGARD